MTPSNFIEFPSVQPNGADAEIASAPVMVLAEDSSGKYVCPSATPSAMFAPVHVSNSEFALLAQCDSFATKEEHVRRLLGMHQRHRRRAQEETLRGLFGNVPGISGLIHRSQPSSPADRYAEASQRLQRNIASLTGKRLFISRRQLAEHLAGLAREPSTSQGVSAICVVSKNRPEALARCIASLQGELSAPGVRLVIAIGGTGTATERTDADASQAAWRIDGRNRHRLVRFLSSSCGEERAARFAVEGWPRAPIDTGAGRNTLLLLTAGERIICVDDDVVVRPLLSKSRDSRILNLDPSDWAPVRHRPQDPRVFDFSESLHGLLAKLTPAHCSLTESISNMLGRSLGELIGSARQIKLEYQSKVRGSRMLTSGPTLCVTTVLTGVIGDSGAGSPAGLLLLRKPSLDSLLASKSLYRTAISNRLCLRSVELPTVSASDVFMATCFGYDNTTPSIPFSPNFRAQDTLFGAMLRSCRPQGCTGYVSEVVHHSPPEPRSFDRCAVRRPPSRGMCWMIGALVQLLQPPQLPVGGGAS